MRIVLRRRVELQKYRKKEGRVKDIYSVEKRQKKEEPVIRKRR